MMSSEGRLRDNGIPSQTLEESVEIEPRVAWEPFVGTRMSELASSTVGDFWQWAYSDIVGNANRGILAEFIVSRALGSTARVRTNWTSYDVVTPVGIKVEVKSSAYLQSWAQSEVSRPQFSIGKTSGWDLETGEYTEEPQRHSDVYVFCLLAYRNDKRQLNPMDLGQWEFYVAKTSMNEAEFGDGKQASLAQVQRICPPLTVDQLPDAVASLGEDSP